WSGSRMTAAAYRGPTSAPRPASSQPATRRQPRRWRWASRRLVQRNSFGSRSRISVLPQPTTYCLLPTYHLLRATYLVLGLGFSDARRLAPQSAQVVEFGAAHARGPDQLDLIDHGGVQRENTLHTLAEGDLTDGERGVTSGTPPANHRPFENLDSFLIALFDPDVHPHGITRAEFRQAFPPLLLFDFLYSCWHPEFSSDWN